MLIKYGIAIVTTNGLIFNHYYYTSSIAIKEQWFELAYTSGIWCIPVIFDIGNKECIFVISKTEIVIAYRIPRVKSLPQAAIKKYQARLRNIKLKYLRAKRMQKQKLQTNKI